MNCPRCQAETPSGAAFCPECGARVTTVYYGARHKGSPHKFCPACGRPLAPSSPEPSPPDPLPPDTGFIGKRP